MENLKQTLRFLERRELQLVKQSELILVCQNECQLSFDTLFDKTKNVNVQSDTYCKPKMTNAGVEQATEEILILLDSDRILPYGYFTRIINSLGEKEVVTTKSLYSLDKPYTDDQIDSGNVTKTPDFKSVTNQGRFKNMFSGNTVLWKQDYLDAGGYDETFVGYGFADSDMTRTALVNGLKFVFRQEEELHLYHDKVYDWENGHIHKDEYRIISAINAIHYCNKWKIEADQGIQDLWNEVENSMPKYRRTHSDQFKKLMNEYRIIHNQKAKPILSY